MRISDWSSDVCSSDLAQEIAPLIAMGEEVLAQGDAERALTIFRQIGDIAPDNAEALSGQIRALVAMGETEQAQAVLDIVPEDIAKEQPIERARAALSLAVDTKPVEDLSGLEARLAANPDDHEARFALAGGHMANGNREAAADALLDIVARDRDWNESAARQQLLKVFEAVGLEDPWVSAQRRRLSAILFG